MIKKIKSLLNHPDHIDHIDLCKFQYVCARHVFYFFLDIYASNTNIFGNSCLQFLVDAFLPHWSHLYSSHHLEIPNPINSQSTLSTTVLLQSKMVYFIHNDNFCVVLDHISELLCYQSHWLHSYLISPCWACLWGRRTSESPIITLITFISDPKILVIAQQIFMS